MQSVDLTTGIESTLAMLSPKLARIEVVREFGANVPLVDVYAAELNQVWTNLIDNAIDAMDGEGTLRLATSVDGVDVVIEIGDTAPASTPMCASACSNRSARPRTSARAPVSESTSPGGSSSTATAATSPSPPSWEPPPQRSASPFTDELVTRCQVKRDVCESLLLDYHPSGDRLRRVRGCIATQYGRVAVQSRSAVNLEGA